MIRIVKPANEVTLFNTYLDDQNEYKVEQCKIGKAQVVKISRTKPSIAPIPPLKLRLCLSHFGDLEKLHIIKLVPKDLVEVEDNKYLLVEDLNFITDDPELIELIKEA